MLLTKHETIVELVDVAEETVTFSNYDIDALPEEDRTDGTVVLRLDKGHWSEMGMPVQVTVTVEPGDRLNAEFDGAALQASAAGEQVRP